MTLKTGATTLSMLVLGCCAFLLSNSSTTVSNATIQVDTLNKTQSLTLNKKEIHLSRLDIPSSHVVYITGPIGSNSSSIISELKSKAKLGQPLYVLIDSPGGSVFQGSMIISAIEASKVKVNTVCVGLCASMAFHIHQSGYKRLMVNRSILMAHPASGGLEGTLEQMRSRLSSISRYVDKLDNYAANRAHIPLDKFKSMIVSEYWVDAEDALEAGFTDEIVDITTDAVPSSQLVFPSEHSKVYIDLDWR